MQASCHLALAPALLAVVAVSLPAQTAAPATLPPLPKGAAALMQIAAQQDSLVGSGMEPWYIHATWQISGSKENPAIRGVFEEWWSGPKTYKAVYTAPNFRQTLSVTASGRSVSGDTQWPDPVLRLIDPLLRSPLPSPSRIPSIRFINRKLKDRKIRLRCAAVAPGTEPRPSLESTYLWFVSGYCFIGDLPAVRMEVAPDLQVLLIPLCSFSGGTLRKPFRSSETDSPGSIFTSTTSTPSTACPPPISIHPPLPYPGESARCRLPSRTLGLPSGRPRCGAGRVLDRRQAPR